MLSPADAVRGAGVRSHSSMSASPTSTASGEQRTASVVPGSWRTQAVRSSSGVTALVAILGRVRRVAFAEPRLNSLREALAKQKGLEASTASLFRVAADADGLEEVLSDEQLERLVRAGRPLHVLQEEVSGDGLDVSTKGDATGSQDGALETESQVDEDKTRLELKDMRNLLQQLFQQEADLASDVLQERHKGAVLETSLEEVRQRHQAELALEREAREAGERDLRLYADNLYGTALGVATRLEQQVASLQVQVEEEMRARTRSLEACGNDSSHDTLLQNSQWKKTMDTQLGERMVDMERSIRKGFETLLSDKIEFIERTIRQDLTDSFRAAHQDLTDSFRTTHAELRSALDATRMRSEQQDAKRQGELEATVVQRLSTLESTIRKVEGSQKQTTGHLETVVSYVAAIQQDAARRDNDIKEVQKSVRDLRQRTRAAVQGTLGLLAEAHSDSDAGSPERSGSPGRPADGLKTPAGVLPTANLGPLPSQKQLSLLPGLPEMTSISSTAEDDGGGSLQDLSRRSVSSLASSQRTTHQSQPQRSEQGEDAAKPTLFNGVSSMASRRPATSLLGEGGKESPNSEARLRAGLTGSVRILESEKETPKEAPAQSLGSRGTSRTADRVLMPRRTGGTFDAAGSLRGLSSDSTTVRAPSNDTVYSSRSLPLNRRDNRSPPHAQHGGYSTATSIGVHSPAQSRPLRAPQDATLTSSRTQQHPQPQRLFLRPAAGANTTRQNDASAHQLQSSES